MKKSICKFCFFYNQIDYEMGDCNVIPEKTYVLVDQKGCDDFTETKPEKE